MPKGKWTAKQERQYLAIEKSEMKRGAKKKTAKRIAAATVNKRRARNPRYLVRATDASGKERELGILVSPNKMQAVSRAKSLYKGHKKYTAELIDKGDYIGPKGVIKIKRKRATKKRNSAGSKAKGVLKSAGKAIKRTASAALTGVSKVAGKAGKALKNPMRMFKGGRELTRQAMLLQRKIHDLQYEETFATGTRLSQIKKQLPKLEARLRKLGDKKYKNPMRMFQGGRELTATAMRLQRRSHDLQYAESIARTPAEAAKIKRELGKIERKLKALGTRKFKSTSKRNPSATSIRKKFAGRVNGSRELYFAKGAPAGMAKLGKLVSIKLKGGKTLKPSRKNPTGEVWLCSDTKGRLWLGSTKDAALYHGQAGNLGEVSTLEYQTSKPHLGDQYKKEIIWFHHMGENGGTKPTLHADGKGGLLFKNGSYKIRREGIVN